MEHLFSLAWLDRVLQALGEAFYHAIASMDTVFCLLSTSMSASHWQVLLSALVVAGLTLASMTALGTE